MLAAFGIGNNISNWPFERRKWKCLFCNSNQLVFAHIYIYIYIYTQLLCYSAFLASLLPFLFARELVYMKKPKYFLLATEL